MFEIKLKPEKDAQRCSNNVDLNLTFNINIKLNLMKKRDV